MVDVLVCLEERGCLHLLPALLATLDSWDLEAVAGVSRAWRRILRRHFWGNIKLRQVVSRNRARGESRRGSILLPHTGQLVGYGVRDLPGTNQFSVWLLHLSAGRGVPCYRYEEWRLCQHLTRLLDHRLLARPEDQQVSVCEAAPGLLAAPGEAAPGLLVLGTNTGRILIHQLERAGAPCQVPALLPAPAPLLHQLTAWSRRW
jgi:hypothetical protein